MSEVIRFTLRGDVSWVNADIYPDAGRCNVMCLTDRQVSIIRQMVYPHALSPCRFVVPAWDRRFTYPSAELAAEHVNEVEDLIDKLGAEATMDCATMLAYLKNVNDAVANRVHVEGTYSQTFGSSATFNLDFATVPAGYKWVIENLFFIHTGTAPANVAMATHISATTATIFQVNAPASGVPYDRHVSVHIPSGGSIRATITTAVSGATIYLRYHGYAVPNPVAP